MWPFVAGTNTHLDLLARLHSVHAALSQHTPVKEGIAGPIGEFDEPKPLVRVEPFYGATDWWTRGCLDGSSTVPGACAEGTGLGVEGVSVELATLRVSEILMSHWLPNLRVVLGQFRTETGMPS